MIILPHLIIHVSLGGCSVSRFKRISSSLLQRSWILLLLIGHAAADDLSPLSDEFDNAASFSNWQDLGIVEGWSRPSYEQADINTTAPGHFHIVPGAITWYNNLHGMLLFKEVTGNFVATTKIRVLSRHNPGDPTEVPNRSFSLTGIFAHAPRAITQAAPSPYTTNPVWPPGNYGSDYAPNTENYIFLSYGSAGNPGTREFEIKATRNSSSQLYYGSTGIDQNETDVWLQMVRVGNTVVCLRKHSENGAWIVENRYPNADHSFPVFGNTLQVGITAYTDWPTAAYAANDPAAAYHYNYAPPSNGNPDLISQVDYFRYRRPHPDLTEVMLQAMSVSYSPATNLSTNPPVLLTASPAAQAYLGEVANLPYQPFANWQALAFGADAGEPQAAAEFDSDNDGVTNLMEFILGGATNESSLHLLPVGAMVGNNFVFTIMPAIAHGARLRVQHSTSLNSWDDVATRPLRGGAWQINMVGASVDVNEVTGAVAITLPSGPPSAFVRLAGDLVE